MFRLAFSLSIYILIYIYMCVYIVILMLNKYIYIHTQVNLQHLKWLLYKKERSPQPRKAEVAGHGWQLG